MNAIHYLVTSNTINALIDRTVMFYCVMSRFITFFLDGFTIETNLNDFFVRDEYVQIFIERFI